MSDDQVNAFHRSIGGKSNCRHSSAASGYDGAELTEAELIETLTCFADAFGPEPWPWKWEMLIPSMDYWMPEYGPWPRADPQWASTQAYFVAHHHHCTNRCPLFKHRDVYICCWNGNHHVCTDIMCNRKVQMHDSLVCSITSLSYPLDWGHSWDQPGGTDDASTSYRQRVNCSNVGVAGIPKKKGKRKRAGDGLSVPVASSRPSKRTRQRSSPLVEEPIVRNLLRFVLPFLDEDGRGKIQRVVFDLWEAVQSTQAWADTSLTSYYALDTHTLAVLYYMKECGLHIRGREVISPNPVLRAQLPTIDRLPLSPLITCKARKHHRKNAGSLLAFLYQHSTAPTVTNALPPMFAIKQ